MIASYLVQKPRTGTLRLPGSVGVDVHRCADIGMTQQLLHILGSSPIRKKIAGERVPLRYNNDKPENPSNDGRFEGLSHLFHSFSNHEKAGQKS